MNRIAPTRRCLLNASLALSGVLMAATTFAAPTTNPYALVQSAVGSDGQVSVSVSGDGVATLSGYVHSSNTRYMAETAVLKGEGVRGVINLISDD